MDNVNDKTILKITDDLDDAALLYFEATRDPDKEGVEMTNYRVEKPHLNYYECLFEVVKGLMGEKTFDYLEESFEKQINDKLDSLRTYMATHDVNSEEVRRALMFLDIRGFKSSRFPLDYITPDAVALICCQLASFILKDKKDATILDFNFGTGNLAFCLANSLNQNIHLVGMENHYLLSQVAAMKANLMQTSLDISYMDCLEGLPRDIDLIVSDIACYDYQNDNYHSFLYNQGVRYFPYLAIEHFLFTQKKLKMLLIIDNDFFSKDGCDKFKEVLNKTGNLLALVALPPTFFNPKGMMKSIIVIQNYKDEERSTTEVFSLPTPNDQTNYLNSLIKIKELLENS